jgi:hypothetical protein
MTHNIRFLGLASMAMTSMFFFNACKKNKEAAGTDKELYDMSRETAGFVWYKKTDVLLNKSSGSGHPQAFFKTWYNSIAAASLDSNGQIQSGASFADGSLIVKELFSDNVTLVRYAILYKKSNSADADAKGWVWGYVNADGTVAEAASKKGKSCIGCHSQAGNEDYMLMNKYFP